MGNNVVIWDSEDVKFRANILGMSITSFKL